MPIFVCGINHTTAPIALREKVVFALEKIPLYLNDLITNENIREAVLLSTCNRSELYCDTEDFEKIIDWFCRQHPISRAELTAAMYFYHDQYAVRHIMNVACGLDSMVLGEPQILGQMKTAFSESVAAGSVGPLFNRLFQQVFSVAKEVRSTTSIGACPVSVSSSAVNLAKQIFSDSLSTATILLVGAGDTIELVLLYLKIHTPKRLLIANRSLENAVSLAEKYDAENYSFSELETILAEADIVISATGSLVPIITKNMLTRRVQSKSIYFIDIAVPRDVEAAVSELEGVQLYSIDDLKFIIQQNRHGREHAAEKAREMIEQKSQDFMSWLNSLDKVASTIRAYRKQIEDLCHVELAKARRQLQSGDDPAEVLTQFARAFTNKLLHTPSVQLRQAGFEGRFDILQFAQQLFAIPEINSEPI